MDTKAIVISDEVMKMVKFVAAKSCTNLDETIEELVYLSEWKGRSLEETIKKHYHYHTEGYKEIEKMEMSPSLAAYCALKIKVPDDYDWKTDYYEEKWQKYLSLK